MPSPAPDYLAVPSLEWALLHVDRHGDTNIFPRPFEIAAIRHNWTNIRNVLGTQDIGTCVTRAAIRLLMPKTRGHFRVIHQLDPLDTLFYTALVYEACANIEAMRVPKEDMVACSYRIAPDANGQFFSDGNGWYDYHSQSRELAESGAHRYVVTADIADFYNQTYHHRIANALETAAIPSDRAKATERLLSQLTARQSRGLPVGPYASIPLAEACLHDVDTRLIRLGYTHVRYVDDFRVFCNSRREAIKLLHELTEYLYTAHRGCKFRKWQASSNLCT